jgi:hypothetical protein
MRGALIVIPLWALLFLAVCSAYDSGYVGRVFHDISVTKQRKG